MSKSFMKLIYLIGITDIYRELIDHQYWVHFWSVIPTLYAHVRRPTAMALGTRTNLGNGPTRNREGAEIIEFGVSGGGHSSPFSVPAFQDLSDHQ